MSHENDGFWLLCTTGSWDPEKVSGGALATSGDEVCHLRFCGAGVNDGGATWREAAPLRSADAASMIAKVAEGIVNPIPKPASIIGAASVQ
jgi:hypothetical protein